MLIEQKFALAAAAEAYRKSREMHDAKMFDLLTRRAQARLLYPERRIRNISRKV